MSSQAQKTPLGERIDARNSANVANATSATSATSARAVARILNEHDVSGSQGHASFEMAESAKRAFKLFSETVLEETFDEVLSVEDIVNVRSLGVARFVAIFMFVVDMFWVVSELLTDTMIDLTMAPTVVALVLQIVGSVVMFAYTFKYKSASGVVSRVAFLLFDAVIIFGVVGLTVARNTQLAQIGVATSLSGFSLSSFFLLLVTVMPRPRKTDSFLVGMLLLVSWILPFAAPGVESYNFQHMALFDVCVVAVYVYFWISQRNAAAREIEITSMAERMAQASFVDALTQALNRQALDRYIEHLRTRQDVRQVGVLMFDLDEFKHYNDFCSHTKGDEALRDVSAAVAEAIEGSQLFLFRYGGEEFIVLIDNPTPYSLMRFGLRVKNAVWDANYERADESEYSRLTISVGCAVESIEDVRTQGYDFVANADAQLYIGKRNKRNCVVIGDEVYR